MIKEVQYVDLHYDQISIINIFMLVILDEYILSVYDVSLMAQLVFLCRDHYVEGRMRGVAPNKKIPAAVQKNDV